MAHLESMHGQFSKEILSESLNWFTYESSWVKLIKLWISQDIYQNRK